MQSSQEKKEAYRAQYDYKVVFEGFTHLEAELKELRQKVRQIKTKENEMDNLIKQKELLIVGSNSPLVMNYQE